MGTPAARASASTPASSSQAETRRSSGIPVTRAGSNVTSVVDRRRPGRQKHAWSASPINAAARHAGRRVGVNVRIAIQAAATRCSSMSSPRRDSRRRTRARRPGQDSLEHDPGGELVVGGADDEPSQHGFGLVGGIGAETGECQEGVEIIEGTIGDAPRPSVCDVLGPVAKAVPFALEAGGDARPGDRPGRRWQSSHAPDRAPESSPLVSQHLAPPLNFPEW